MTTKTKDSSNGIVKEPAVQDFKIKSPITQRDIETWSDEFEAVGGLEAKGLFRTAGAYVKALAVSGLLLEPNWTTEDDVLDGDPSLIVAIFRAFDDTYGELSGTDPN